MNVASLMQKANAYHRSISRNDSQIAGDERPLDEALFVVTLLLLVFGLTMVYSASAVFAHGRFGEDTYFLQRQALHAAAGLLLILSIRFVPTTLLRRHLNVVLGVGLLLLVLVAIPGIGRVAGGARRWLPLGPFSVQPAELSKLLVIVFMARAIARRAEGVSQRSLWVSAAWSQVLAVLVLLERDLGTAIVLELCVLIMLFVGGAKLRGLFIAVVALVPVGAYLVYSQPYRIKRVSVFLDPFADRHGAGYQLSEAFISFGSGGLFGAGLGDGRQKLFFLPEAHTDFIFSIVGEELGFVGIVTLIALFATYLWLCAAMAARAQDPFNKSIILGVSLWLISQAAINMAVATGMLPTKGLTLPFISYGGSSLLVTCLGTALVLAADRGRMGASS